MLHTCIKCEVCESFFSDVMAHFLSEHCTTLTFDLLTSKLDRELHVIKGNLIFNFGLSRSFLFSSLWQARDRHTGGVQCVTLSLEGGLL